MRGGALYSDKPGRSGHYPGDDWKNRAAKCPPVRSSTGRSCNGNRKDRDRRAVPGSPIALSAIRHGAARVLTGLEASFSSLCDTPTPVARTADTGRYGGCGVRNDKSRCSFLELVDGRKRPSGRRPAAPVGIPLKDQHEANNGMMISARRAWAPQVLGETSHQSRSELRTGAKARPHAVRSYSTRGGTWW
jgi:hypothetical protein